MIGMLSEKEMYTVLHSTRIRNAKGLPTILAEFALRESELLDVIWSVRTGSALMSAMEDSEMPCTIGMSLTSAIPLWRCVPATQVENFPHRKKHAFLRCLAKCLAAIMTTPVLGGLSKGPAKCCGVWISGVISSFRSRIKWAGCLRLQECVSTVGWWNSVVFRMNSDLVISLSVCGGWNKDGMAAECLPRSHSGHNWHGQEKEGEGGENEEEEEEEE